MSVTKDKKTGKWMVGVCSARTVTFSLEHQSVGTEDIKKPVTSDDELVTEELTAQMV